MQQILHSGQSAGKTKALIDWLKADRGRKVVLSTEAEKRKFLEAGVLESQIVVMAEENQCLNDLGSIT